MAVVDNATTKLAGLLRHADDLDKLPALKAEFQRKKQIVDDQLRVGLQEQLQITQLGITSISDGQRTVALIKEEMTKIDKLCAEAQNMITNFPFVDKIAQTHRNFAQVEEMRSSIEGFGPQLDELEVALEDDERDLDNQNNLLSIHYTLTKLRDTRDQAINQVHTSQDAGIELINNLQLHGGVTLQDHFNRLDSTEARFDLHIQHICENLIELVTESNTGIIVRLALILEQEEKRDIQVRALQDAQKEFKDLTSRLQSMNIGQREPRNYKQRMIDAITDRAAAKFADSSDVFEQDPDKLEKSLRWFFNELNTVKLGMANLFPKKWAIFTTYIDIYHQNMHDFLISLADDQALGPRHLKALLQWVDKYYAKMTKLGVPTDSLKSHVLDDRESELVREYRTIIVEKFEQWMDNLAATDEKAFTTYDDSVLDEDEHGCLRTRTLGDVWRMLNENLATAAMSERNDVCEGVVDSMMRALKKRQTQWAKLVDAQTAAYKSSAIDPSQESNHEQLLRWMIALANDQIACIDDNEESGQTTYVTQFQNYYSSMVSSGWATLSEPELDDLRTRYVDLGTHCISAFVTLVYSECRDPTNNNSVFDDFFVARWYSVPPMPRILATVEDYLELVQTSVHPSLRDILIEEFSDAFLVRYLSSVTKNSSVKFRRTDKFVDRVRQDIKDVKDYFSKYEASYPVVFGKWKAVGFFLELINATKGAGVVAAYGSFKTNHWDLQMSWVEGVLKTRDDYDRAMLAAVKAHAAQVQVERGVETVMSKVK